MRRNLRAPVRHRRLELVLLVGALAVLIGTAMFFARAGLDSIGDITASRRTVRFEQNHGVLRELGPIGILLAVGPVLAGLIGLSTGTPRARSAALLAAIAIGVAVFVNPSRTYAGTVIAVGVLAWLFAAGRRQQRRLAVRPRRVVGAVLVAILAGYAFNLSSAALGKVATTESAPPGVVHYAAGGIPGLAVATDRPYPIDGWGRSVRLPVRAYRIVFGGPAVASSIARFSAVRPDGQLRTNLYTWIGDVYFDYGVLGVSAFGILVGSVGASLHRRRLRKPTARTILISAVWTVANLASIGGSTWLSESTALSCLFAFVLASGVSRRVERRHVGNNVTSDTTAKAARVGVDRNKAWP